MASFLSSSQQLSSEPTAGVVHSIWEGTLPVIFELAKNEVTTLKAPEPALKLVPRMSYLPLFAIDVVEHFRAKYAPPRVGGARSSEDNVFQNVWFEYKNQPLRWHLPAGVLFDATGNFAGDNLPWRIVVHFQGFPEDKIIRLDNLEATRWNFMSELKQAVHVRMGSSKTVLDLAMDDQEQLWSAVETTNADAYWDINKMLITEVEDTRIARIPCRVVVANKRTRSFQVFQRPIEPFRDMDGEKREVTTVHDALEKMYRAVDGTTADDGTTRRVMVQGIEMEPTEALLPLSNAMSHADNFLYIIVLEE